MSHTAEISRRNPACILILLDQSGSMRETLPTEGTTKAQGVADVVNNLLAELIDRNASGEEICDRAEVGVITYGGDDIATPLSATGLARLSELEAKPLRVDTRQVEKYLSAGRTGMENIVMPIWFDPVSNGRTPMCAALERARVMLEGWTAAHPASFPPLVVNVTDGEATDGDPASGFQALQALGTQDGAVLVMNVLITQKAGNVKFCYPTDAEEMWDPISSKLFEGSSLFPEALRKGASERLGREVPAGARAVVLNAGLVDLIQTLDIGTRAARN